MKEIEDILKKQRKALTYKELKNLYHGDNFDSELKEAIKNARVYKDKDNKYILFSLTPYKVGRLRANKKGFAFVDFDDYSVYIDPDDVNGALDDDLVAIEIMNKTSKGLDGVVVAVLDRAHDTVVGEIYKDNNRYYIKPTDEKILAKIEAIGNNLVEGYIVLAKLELESSNKYKGYIKEILGHKNDPHVDILSIAYSHGFTLKLEDSVLEELEKIPSKVLDKDRVDRTDLTNLKIFTIDGSDTKDIDDAISIRKTNEGYDLGVHIADVSYYVKKATALDRSAYRRSTSVYLTDYVLPMLPHQLSNGICSLNEGEDRLAISTFMRFDNDGNKIGKVSFPSVIRSKKKMSYDKVNDILDNNIIDSSYSDYVDELRLMHELATKINRVKKKKGSIDFNSAEIKILVDEDGKPIDIVKDIQGTGEKIIEEFMVSANESIAELITSINMPCLYRVHESPDSEQIEEFINFINNLGYNIEFNSNMVNPLEFQKLLDSFSDDPKADIINYMGLRSMKKAIYSSKNLGHFGLASSCYTHFTSPIRRYPDITVHRLLREFIFDKNLSNKSKWEGDLVKIGKYTSMQEREAVECEREVNDMKMAEYMKDHIGEVYKAKVSGITNFGIFVQLDNLVEGLVPVATLDGYYTFNEKTYSLDSQNNSYHMGDELVVTLVNASKDTKEIDFVIGDRSNEEKKDKK